MTKWDKRYMDLANMVATWSKDPRTKVGCVLVGSDPRDITFGYNGFPPGIADTPERLADRAMKNMLTQHAERNVLDNARFDTKGARIITTRFPCHECAKSMISRGIGFVLAPAPHIDPAHFDPAWEKSSQLAEAILREANVVIEYYEDPVIAEHRRAIAEGRITGADQDSID